VEALAAQYSKIIKDLGGEVTKTEFCGLRNLAYKINKNRKGSYVLLNITGKGDGIAEIERQMRLNEDVLRYLTVSVDELDPNPSALMQQKNFREERYRSFDDDGDFSGGDFGGRRSSRGPAPEASEEIVEGV
jgi:small subunit ribosomal protein S6